MSVAQIPDSVDSSADLQIWNNATFDNREISQDLAVSKQSWGSLNSIFANATDSFDSVSGKENQGFAFENHISSLVVTPSLKSASKPFKPLNSVEKSRIKEVVKKGFVENSKGIRDGKKVDEEIEEIESQISRLNSRLEALKLEKAGRSVKALEKRGRVVAAKFIEQKQSGKNGEEKKTVEDISSLSSRTKVNNRRGISLGPSEIVSLGRRGMSLCPSEIFGAAKSRQLAKQEMITPLQSRRMSCMLKLQNIDEDRVKSCSLSPKSRKVAAKAQVMPRQAVTTIASGKTMKKGDLVMNSVQPKTLFKDEEKSALGTNKKARPGRMIASRYSQNAASQAPAMRKRSLPENDGDNSKRMEKKRSLSVGKTRPHETEGKNIGTESRVKKRWEIPTEITIHGSSLEAEKSPCLLPRLRIARCNGSPRDSGPAKKIAELVGKKSFFGSDEYVEKSLCQALNYEEEEER